MAQHGDLGILRRLAAAEQEQPAKDPDDDEIQKSDRHRPRSCLITVSRPNRRSPPHIDFWSGTGWYADFRAGDDHVVAFAGKVFRYPRGDQDGRAGAMDYGRPTGVPEHQLDWPD
jgi:hypothetical protein